MLSRHGSLEGSILNALWNLEQKGIYTNSVKDVYDTLCDDLSEHRAYTTIKTVMDRLVAKKILMRFKNGRKFYYRTAYSCHEIIEKSLFDVADKYLDGDFNKLKSIINSIHTKNCFVSSCSIAE